MKTEVKPVLPVVSPGSSVRTQQDRARDAKRYARRLEAGFAAMSGK